MNMSSDEPISPGEQAILEKDAQALARALEGRWSFPLVCNRAGQGETDYSLLFQCISWRWKEGWDLLAGRWPELRSDYRVLRRVLANAWPQVLAEIVPANFPLDNDDPDSPSVLADFIQTIANPNNEHLLDADIGLCAKHMFAHGADPATVFPGEFDLGDLRLAGHTIWTLAVRSKRWELAGMVAPSADQALRHPRFEESMDAWFYSGFMHESPLRPEPSSLARASLLSNGHLMIPWLEESPVLMLEQAWPLLMSLSEQDRKAVWAWVGASGARGVERLEVLASGLVDGCSNEEEGAQEVCRTMAREGGRALQEAWYRKAGHPPMSAADTWDISIRAMCHGKKVASPFEPAQDNVAG